MKTSEEILYFVNGQRDLHKLNLKNSEREIDKLDRWEDYEDFKDVCIEIDILTAKLETVNCIRKFILEKQ